MTICVPFGRLIVLVCILQLHIDVFFCGKLYTLWIDKRLTHSEDYFVLMILCIVFIVVPILANLFQLHLEIGKWTQDAVLQGTEVPLWIKSKIKFVYLLAIFCGSSFSAIALVNSYLFQLNTFSMGLSQFHKSIFQNKRFFSIVLFEVKCILYNDVSCVYINALRNIMYTF